MNKVLLIFVLWMAVDYVTPFAFAAENGGIDERAIQIEAKKLESPNSTLPPEMKCGFCSEVHQIKTVKVSQDPSPSPSGADVKGIEATPKPSVRATINPFVKPAISPSPLSSPSASISASPSVQPTAVPIEEKQTPTILKIWNWILNLFNSQV